MPNAILLEGQHPHGLAKIAKVENVPYREGIGPLVHAPMGRVKPRTPHTIQMTAEVFATNFEDLGGMHSSVTQTYLVLSLG